MALTNYDELKTELQAWLHRNASILPKIPDFIALAESEINADLQNRLMESDETIAVTAGSRTAALPSRFVEPIKLSIVVSGQDNEELVFRPIQQLQINETSFARPVYWSINGNNIEFDAPVDVNYTMILRCVRGLDLASTGTNVVMTEFPGLYLFGALGYAAPYLVNDARIHVWRENYQRLLQKAKRKDSRSRAITTLRTTLPTTVDYAGNTFTGER